ncbi:DoxX family protein [Undibacterium griseum]|uniref:DoxX family protein n=1 Tax=Undibacterium griseum TaxID=2762295 RepID=A0ABR6YIU6_9BURK|nr:DoxX family protein [Undibacterium griseum]MBC3883846.1 DoxX family protein [Undibacterium griseum]
MKALENYGPLVARVLMALIFVMSGVGKITGFDGTVGYIASKGLPLPALAAVAAIIVELGGGLMLIAGWKARWAALVMMLFTLAAAAIFHDFWHAAADAAQNQTIHFMKNLAIAGGLLMIGVHGSGACSVEKA